MKCIDVQDMVISATSILHRRNLELVSIPSYFLWVIYTHFGSEITSCYITMSLEPYITNKRVSERQRTFPTFVRAYSNQVEISSFIMQKDLHLSSSRRIVKLTIQSPSLEQQL